MRENDAQTVMRIVEDQRSSPVKLKASAEMLTKMFCVCIHAAQNCRKLCHLHHSVPADEAWTVVQMLQSRYRAPSRCVVIPCSLNGITSIWRRTVFQSHLPQGIIFVPLLMIS